MIKLDILMDELYDKAANYAGGVGLSYLIEVKGLKNLLEPYFDEIEKEKKELEDIIRRLVTKTDFIQGIYKAAVNPKNDSDFDVTIDEIREMFEEKEIQRIMKK